MPRARRAWTVLFFFAHHFLCPQGAPPDASSMSATGEKGKEDYGQKTARGGTSSDQVVVAFFELIERNLGQKSVTSAMNRDRYLKIAKAFQLRGAYQGDPGKAMGGVMLNRRSNDYNDVGWDILPGNYHRFLTLIDPDASSIGWWHKGPWQSVYGRFARGFDVAAEKDTMYFRLADQFCKERAGSTLLLRVIYLDEAASSWTLSYHTTTGIKEALAVTNTGSGHWRETTVTVHDAAMRHGGPRGADLMLSSKRGDTVFHLLEIERRSAGSSESVTR